MCKFVIIPIAKGAYYFELEGESREILLTSREFKSVEDCEKKAALVVSSCRNDTHTTGSRAVTENCISR